MASRKQSQAAQSNHTPPPNLPERERERATAYLAAVVEVEAIRSAERAAAALRTVAGMMQEQAEQIAAGIAALGDTVAQLEREAEDCRKPFAVAFARLQNADRLVVEALGESVLAGEYDREVPGARVRWQPGLLIDVAGGAEAWPDAMDGEAIRDYMRHRSAELATRRADRKAQQEQAAPEGRQ